jgi:hypothetical protein
MKTNLAQIGSFETATGMVRMMAARIYITVQPNHVAIHDDAEVWPIGEMHAAS